VLQAGRSRVRCLQNFSLIKSFRPHYGPGVDSDSKRNENQEYSLAGKVGRCVGLTTLPSSYVDCLEIWEPSGSVIDLCRDCFTFALKYSVDNTLESCNS
jgi:hypothetical protein